MTGVGTHSWLAEYVIEEGHSIDCLDLGQMGAYGEYVNCVVDVHSELNGNTILQHEKTS